MNDQLENTVRRLHELPSPLRWDDVVARSEEADLLVLAGSGSGSGSGSSSSSGSRPRPSTPRRRMLIGLVAAAAAAVLVGVVVWRTDARTQQVTTDPGPTVTSHPAPPSSIVADPTDPLSPALVRRSGQPVTAVTDTEYLVWGGEGLIPEVDRTDGFSVDLATGQVREIPAAPLPPGSLAGTGVWSGDELVVWTFPETYCEDCDPLPAAAWNPATRTWRSIASAPGDAAGNRPAVAATDTGLVTVSTTGAAAAYDLESDSWSALPAAPAFPSFGATVVSAGSDIVYWPTSYFGGPFPADIGGPVADRGWRLTPGASEWEPLPDLPEGHRTTLASIVWTGDEILVWGTATGGGIGSDDTVPVGAVIRLGDEAWRPLAPSPQGPDHGFEGTDGSQRLIVVEGTDLVFVVPIDLGGGVADRLTFLYDTASETWTTTHLGLQGFAPTLDLADDRVFVPDPVDPVVGDIGAG